MPRRTGRAGSVDDEAERRVPQANANDRTWALGPSRRRCRFVRSVAAAILVALVAIIGGSEAGGVDPPPDDVRPPVVLGELTVPASAWRWLARPAEIVWSPTDPVPSSGLVGPPPPATPVDTEGFWRYSSDPVCDAAGNCASGDLAVGLDLSDPTIEVAVAPGPNDLGWHAGPVEVTFICADAVSGIAPDGCTPPVVLSVDGLDQSVTGRATDLADRTANVVVGGISIDQTPPVVAFHGVQAVYGLTETIAITCTAADALSGVVSADCPELSGPAADHLGTTTLAASATDAAGNTATTSITFEVSATGADLLYYIQLYLDGNRGAIRSLTNHAEAIIDGRCGGRLNAFTVRVAMLRRVGELTRDQADTLVGLANELCD